MHQFWADAAMQLTPTSFRYARKGLSDRLVYVELMILRNIQRLDSELV